MNDGLISFDGGGPSTFGGPGVDNVVHLPGGAWLFVYQDGANVEGRYFDADGEPAGAFGIANGASNPVLGVASDGSIYAAFTDSDGVNVVTLPPTPSDEPTITAVGSPLNTSVDAGSLRLLGLQNGDFALGWVAGGKAEVRVFGDNGAPKWSAQTADASSLALTRDPSGETLIAAVVKSGQLFVYSYDSLDGTADFASPALGSGVVGSPDVAMLNPYPAQGIYGQPYAVVTWEADGKALAQVINVDGTPYEDPFVVAEAGAAPSVAVLTSGEVAFSYTAADGAGTRVYSVTFSYTGLRTSDPVLVHDAEGDQSGANLTARPIDQSVETGDSAAQTLNDMISLRGSDGQITGETLIVWTVPGEEDGKTSIRLGHYDTDGEVIGTPQTIVSNTPDPSEINIIQLADGRAVVMWTEADTGTSALKLQILGADQAPVGEDQTLAVDGLTNPSLIDVVATEDGGFAFVFAATGPTGTEIHAGQATTVGTDGAVTPALFKLVDAGATTLTPEEVTGQAVAMEGVGRTALVFASDYRASFTGNDVYVVSFAADGLKEGPLQVSTQTIGLDGTVEGRDSVSSAVNPTVTLLGPDIHGGSLYTGGVVSSSDIFYRALMVAWEVDQGTKDNGDLIRPNVSGPMNNGVYSTSPDANWRKESDLQSRGIPYVKDTEGTAIMTRVIGYAADDYSRPNLYPEDKPLPAKPTLDQLKNVYVLNSSAIDVEKGDFVHGPRTYDWRENLVAYDTQGNPTTDNVDAELTKTAEEWYRHELELPSSIAFPHKPERLLNDDLTAGNQAAPQIITLLRTDGSEIDKLAGTPVETPAVVVVYTSGGGQDGDDTRVYFKLLHPFSATTTPVPVTASIMVNTQSAGDQTKPLVQPVEGGGFRVAFQSVDVASGEPRIMAAEFDRNGQVVSADAEVFTITYTTGSGAEADAFAKVGQIEGYDEFALSDTTDGTERPDEMATLLDPDTGKPTGRYVVAYREAVYAEDGSIDAMIGRFQIFDDKDQPVLKDAQGNPQSGTLWDIGADENQIHATELPNGGFALSSGMRMWVFRADGTQVLYDGMAPGAYITLNASGTDGIASWADQYAEAYSLPDGTLPVEGAGYADGAYLHSFKAATGESRVFVTYASQGQGGIAQRSALMGRIFDVKTGEFVTLSGAARATDAEGPLNQDTTIFHVGAGLPETVNGAGPSDKGFELNAKRSVVDLGDGTSLIGVNAQYGASAGASQNFLVRIDNETGEAFGDPVLDGPGSQWAGYPLSPLRETDDGAVDKVLLTSENAAGLRAKIIEISAPSDTNPSGLTVSQPVDAAFPGGATGSNVRPFTWGTGLYDPEKGQLSGKFVLISADQAGSLVSGSRQEYTLTGRIYDANGVDGPVPIGDAFAINPAHDSDDFWPAGVLPRADGGFTIGFNQTQVALNGIGSAGIYGELDASAVSFDASGNLINQDPSRFVETALLCFLQGTQIATPRGEVPVETLRIGDLVLTADGRSVPVRWMGRQTVRNTPATSAHHEPVRIRAGALGGGLPHRDLFVSAGHAMIFGDLAITAAAMVNGDSIDFVPLADMPDAFVYWHIETEGHDVILANGAPAETFVDCAERAAFDNYDEYLGIYGNHAPRVQPRHTRILTQRMIPSDLRLRLGITRSDTTAEVDRLMALARAGR